MPSDDDFAQLTAPYRGELLAHCYRMLGSRHDAEDLVQETLLRAWRGYDGFEGRSSLRTWLYRIATRACLNELEKAHRRVLPSGLGAPGEDATVPTGDRRPEVPWLEPIPDALIQPQDPAEVAQLRQSTRLALIAAMQLLPARQRAVLILRDVLGWRAGEVAELLATTTDSVNSSLLRSRAQVARLAPDEDEIAEPGTADRRTVLDRYVAAFEDADMAGLVELLHQDVVLEMPPAAIWFVGQNAVDFLTGHLPTPRAWRFVPIRANGQWAVASYRRGDDGVLQAHALHLLAVIDGRIQRITVFLGSALFAGFGLPLTLPDSLSGVLPVSTAG